MKTLGRVLIILAVFAIVMGLTYVVVNAGSSSTTGSVPAFEGGGENFRRPQGGRPDFDGDGARGGSWSFGFAKNISIIAIIVTVIIVPKAFMRRKAVAARVH